jgi:hypothetical protein
MTPNRDHIAEAALLGYRTGLSAAICQAWIAAPIARSAKAIKAAFLPSSDDDCIVAARSEIDSYALAQVKEQRRGRAWPGIEGRYLN